MGRQVRRVSIDFKWPLNKVWKGFINPHYVHNHDCKECDGSGYAPVAKEFFQEWYGYKHFDPVAYGSQLLTPETPAVKDFSTRNVDRNPEYFLKNDLSREEGILMESNRLCGIWNEQWGHHLIQADVDVLISAEYEPLYDFTHSKPKNWEEVSEEYIRVHAYYLWLAAGSPDNQSEKFWNDSVEDHVRWLPYPNGFVPTVEFCNNASISYSFGTSNWCGACIKGRCKRENVEHYCPACGGNGSVWDSPEYKKLAEEWTDEEPPVGDAYQIWETVSEGSPISPPFLNPKKLAEWMVRNDTSITKNTTVNQWVSFINGPGWAPSAVGSANGGFVSGVEAVTSQSL